MHSTTLFFLAAAAAPSVLGHGWIKQWAADGGAPQKAQKQSLASSAFRASPDNTGWIGSNFLTSGAITCGSSQTPFNTVASPGGTLFSSADQSAGKTLATKAGGFTELWVAGNPGVGWPHPRGNVQVYLGYCGESTTACQKFDASKAAWFKIHSEVNGIQNTLKPAYDGSVDGNKYKVPIPSNIKDGSYLMRFELIAFGQSSGAEGGQDQYYPFCGQISVTGGSSAANKFQTVTFPGAYKNGKISEGSLPGPQALASGPASGGSDTSANSTEDTGSSGSTDASSGDSSSGSTPSDSSSGSGSSGSCSSRRRRRRHNRSHKRQSRHGLNRRSDGIVIQSKSS
jgi:hypothetical protein